MHSCATEQFLRNNLNKKEQVDWAILYVYLVLTTLTKFQGIKWIAFLALMGATSFYGACEIKDIADSRNDDGKHKKSIALTQI